MKRISLVLCLFLAWTVSCASLAQTSANTVLAGPMSGGGATATYRSLVGADLPNPSSSTLGGVESFATVSHQFLNGISTGGIPSAAQPAFSDISGSVIPSQLPAPSVCSLASAATVDLGTCSQGQFVTVSGSTTITSLGSTAVAGSSYRVFFSGTLTVTNGTNLHLPGGQNITTVGGGGDVMDCYVPSTAGTWYCTLPLYNSNLAIFPSGEIYITSNQTILAGSISLFSSTIPTNGVYQPAAGELGFSSSGSGAALFDTSRRFLLGYTSDQGGGQLLQVNGSALVSGNLALGASPTLSTTSGSLVVDSGSTQLATFATTGTSFGNGTNNSMIVAAPGANTFVNYLNVSGAITGNAPYLFFTGSDASIGGQFYLKGTGTYNFVTRGDSTQVSQFRILDNSSGANYIRVTSGATNALMDTNAGGLTIQPNNGLINIPALSASSIVWSDGTKNLTSTAASQAQNAFYAAPSGSSGAPTFRSIAAADLPSGVSPVLSGTSSSIGGSALLAGACSSGTATVTGATTSMVAQIDPNTYPGDGAIWEAYVSASNTVTVKVCAIVALTPTASTYNVRVFQ